MNDSIPFAERPTCTIHQACQASGLGRTKIYEAIRAGKLESIKLGKRRLVVVPSLLDLVGGAAPIMMPSNTGGPDGKDH